MKKTVLSVILSSLLASTLVANIAPTSKEVSKRATQSATNKAVDKKAQLVQEALSSLELSSKALQELEENNLDKAKEDITLALGKLEAILATKETPKLLPIEQRVSVKNFVGSADAVEVVINEVKRRLNKGNIQEARVLLSSLQSEIDVTVVSLPLLTYPDALKLASKYIIEEQPNKAKEVLKVALSTFTEVQQVIPIPLVNTLKLVEVASTISKSDKEQALKYLASASDELDKAKKLGYVSKSETTYKELHQLIKDVQKEVEGPNKAEELFIKLKEKVKEFKENIFSSQNKK